MNPLRNTDTSAMTVKPNKKLVLRMKYSVYKTIVHFNSLCLNYAITDEGQFENPACLLIIGASSEGSHFLSAGCNQNVNGEGTMC